MRAAHLQNRSFTTLPMAFEHEQRYQRVASGVCTCLVVDGLYFRELPYPACRKHPNAPAYERGRPGGP